MKVVLPVLLVAAAMIRATSAGSQALSRETDSIVSNYVRSYVTAVCHCDANAVLRMAPPSGDLYAHMMGEHQWASAPGDGPLWDTAQLQQIVNAEILRIFTRNYQRGELSGLRWSDLSLVEVRLENIEPLEPQSEAGSLNVRAFLLFQDKKNERYAAEMREFLIVGKTPVAGRLGLLERVPLRGDSWVEAVRLQQLDETALTDTVAPAAAEPVGTQVYSGRVGTNEVRVSWSGSDEYAGITSEDSTGMTSWSLLNVRGNQYTFYDAANDRLWKLSRNGEVISGEAWWLHEARKMNFELRKTQ